MRSSSYHLIVVGGGAAGFFGAISAAELSSGSPKKILILEKGSEVLQKVKISGGGRCNVTHDCHEIRDFVTRYPRGEKALHGPFHRWNAADMINWLGARGVELKTEADGRMFPVTNDSQTVIHCLQKAAREHDIEVRCREAVESIGFEEETFHLRTEKGDELNARNILLATGGIRNGMDKLARQFGHTILPAAPSLFTFKINDPRLEDLAGISVPNGSVEIEGTSFTSNGPILITHWGLSGPAVLVLSARAARELQERNYQFAIRVKWVPPGGNLEESLAKLKTSSGKQSVAARAQFGIPSRLWRKLCDAAKLPADLKWGNISRAQLSELQNQLDHSRFEVAGKSMNKDEFVTCGGVSLKEINGKTMESKKQPGLFFAGELLDIDGVTGGFNFQAAWTTARLAGQAIADR